MCLGCSNGKEQEHGRIVETWSGDRVMMAQFGKDDGFPFSSLSHSLVLPYLTGFRAVV